MQDIITLPKVILNEKKDSSTPLFIYKHESIKQSLKNKILLQYNLISLLQSGEKILYYANRTISITPSQFAILSSGNCLMSEKSSMDKAYCSILFFFDNAALTDFFIKYSSLLQMSASRSIKAEEPFLVFEQDDFVKNFAGSLDFILQKSSSSAKEILRLKFEEFMLYLLEKHPQPLLALRATNQNEYTDFKIKEAVEKNITTNITVEELAFLCNTSASTFKRRFIRIYNATPSHYFLHRKMEIASSLLLQRENPSEVFFKVGYENHSSFSQSFKLVFGISPKQYQQKHLTY